MKYRESLFASSLKSGESSLEKTSTNSPIIKPERGKEVPLIDAINKPK